MTAALEGGECSTARPGRNLPSGKSRCPFYRRLGGPQGRSGRAENLVKENVLHKNLNVYGCMSFEDRDIYLYILMISNLIFIQ